MTTAKKETFEASLQRLEDIVRDLESGEKGLEDSLKLFEDGVSLSRGLTAKLEDVKKRVEVLTKEGKDKLKAKPLEEETE
ncbi:MAG: exodeoxyribonuclease VII small subunit [Elusimicrobia bacterium]|nr:exodeoxyribonuclease VII small subunit [Elusimicrobiota bacterium]